jgi:hypothetical protein
MSDAQTTRSWVFDETRALLARASHVRPLVMQEAMTPAAAARPRTQRAIEQSLRRDRERVVVELHRLLRWLTSPRSTHATGTEMRERLVHARMQFNDALSNFDLFVDAITQRSERDSGVWLAGLDAVAEDVLAMPGYYDAPPVLCFLARGPGASIRRARTRLPGGGANPIALIQIPRERMIGTGVATSLAHETGHQAAALLQLLASLRAELRATGAPELWDRWLSEIVADLWAVAKLGPTATVGAMAVLGLPTYFMFRISPSDPHPPPWLRIHLSAAFGEALYPDPQWAELVELWNELYPLGAAPDHVGARLRELLRAIPAFRDLVVRHRCRMLSPRPLGEAIAIADRHPAALRAETRCPRWRRRLGRGSPARALAILGQARWSRSIRPDEERRAVSNLLATWAIRRALNPSDPT